jgi:hypothetical protein
VAHLVLVNECVQDLPTGVASPSLQSGDLMENKVESLRSPEFDAAALRHDRIIKQLTDQVAEASRALRLANENLRRALEDRDVALSCIDPNYVAKRRTC